MILQKIKLKNFRQFKGEQEIVFSENIPSITIVYGANGRGKTGLFRALMFGLFDDRRLPQDDNINAKDINLVNKQALEENEGHPVMAEVTVVLLADGVKYTIKRCIQGIKRGDQTAEQPFSVTLSITDEKLIAWIPASFARSSVTRFPAFCAIKSPTKIRRSRVR